MGEALNLPKSIHANYSSLTDLRPPVKLMREERRRTRRGRVGRCGWPTDRVAPTMLGRLQAMLPAAGGGGGRFWGLDSGAGCRSARTRLAHGGGRGGAGCTVVQKAQARCSLASTSSQGSFCSSSASSHFIPFEKLYYSFGHWLDNSCTHEGAWYWHWP